MQVPRLVSVRMGPFELGKLRPGEFRDLTKREIDSMTAPTAQPAPQVRSEMAPSTAPQVARAQPVRPVAQRVARRVPPARARVGPVESARVLAPRVTRRAAVSRARVDGPRGGGRFDAPRATRPSGGEFPPRAGAGRGGGGGRGACRAR